MKKPFFFFFFWFYFLNIFFSWCRRLCWCQNKSQLNTTWSFTSALTVTESVTTSSELMMNVSSRAAPPPVTQTPTAIETSYLSELRVMKQDQNQTKARTRTRTKTNMKGKKKWAYCLPEHIDGSEENLKFCEWTSKIIIIKIQRQFFVIIYIIIYFYCFKVITNSSLSLNC